VAVACISTTPGRGPVFRNGLAGRRTKKEALAMIDEALTFLQGGLDALRRRP
jgi:hypothetical protein